MTAIRSAESMMPACAQSGWALAEPFRVWAQRKPDAPCVVCEGTVRTWRAVDERSSRLAQGLLAAGLEPQDRIIYLGRNRGEFFEILLGASKAGVVTAALNWRLAAREMCEIIAPSRARMLFAEPEFVERIDSIRDRIGAALPTVVVGGKGRDDHDYEPWLAAHPDADPRVAVRELDAAVQMYTSGTTGSPRGVVYSNATMRTAVPHASLIEVDETSVELIAMPVFHSVGSSFGAQALSVGATVVVARDFVPETLLGLIDDHRVTSAPLVPAALKMLVESPEIAERDLSSLRTIIYAGSPISPELFAELNRRFDCRIMQVYGSTETGMATRLSPEDHLDGRHPERWLSCGRSVPGSTVRVVDPLTGVDVAEGAHGEVWVRCSTQMSGYWDSPDETAAVTTPDGFIRTGDGGYLRDGYLYLRDRIKDLIVSGGENVYPVEVENVLIMHPGVCDVAVIGVASAKWGETVKALVVRQPWAADLDETALIAFAKRDLAGYKCPTTIDFLDELPRNPSGKLLKRVLRERYPVGTTE